MVAKFVVLALAVCSASASVCVPACFQAQEQCGSLGAITEVVPAPVPTPAVTCSVTPKFVVAPQAVVPAPEIVSADSFTATAVSGSNGPSVSSRSLPVIQAPPVTLNPVESPIIRLPSPPVPGPRVIRHRCYCTKTIVRPQVIQRTITVPRIQRYLKQSYRPIVENVAYQARPVGSDSQGEDIVIGGSSACLSSGPFVSSSSPVTLVSSGVFQESGDCGSPCPVEPVCQSIPRCY